MMLAQATELINATDDLTKWAVRLAVVSLFGYIWRNERKQSMQDLAIKELELDIERNRPHKSELTALRIAVEKVDRLVRKMAAKQGISTREDD